MYTEHPIWQSRTAEMAAKELRPGHTVRYEPPEVAGRGYAALLIDTVERTPDGTVTIEWSESRLDVVLFDSSSDLPPLLDDEYDLVQWPDSLSFDPEETVIVEIKPPAYV